MLKSEAWPPTTCHANRPNRHIHWRQSRPIFHLLCFRAPKLLRLVLQFGKDPRSFCSAAPISGSAWRRFGNFFRSNCKPDPSGAWQRPMNSDLHANEIRHSGIHRMPRCTVRRSRTSQRHRPDWRSRTGAQQSSLCFLGLQSVERLPKMAGTPLSSKPL